MTVKRIGGKLKTIRTNFEKAVDTNKRSGGGRVILKVPWCRFEKLPTCSCSNKNTTLKISHS